MFYVEDQSIHRSIDLNYDVFFQMIRSLKNIFDIKYQAGSKA